VGIGASAGGLEALKAFFGAMPAHTGLVFVVVVHLDPTHESLMPELLARSTTVTVKPAEDRQPLEADHVYIIPPNRTLTIDQGLLHVQEVVDRRGLRGTIDHFFRSLAEDQQDQGVVIVLSGTGTEGTLGAGAVKAAGGLVMAQSPETATQPGMPTSAIAAGVVDMVLPPEKMPEALLKFLRSRRIQGAPAAIAELPPSADLAAIVGLLRGRTRHDFRGYKKGTLQRRIERRMSLLQTDTLARYLAFLRSHPVEVDQLFKDLLIGVTSFFRDPTAFDELSAKVLPKLVKEHDPESPIRVWVPGCSTGEEAYSIAILLAEQIASLQSGCQIQVFATDVDERALEIARAGAYPESIALDVTADRLRRYFTHEDHRFTIVKPVRASVTFAAQNAITDPPFSRLDLVSCRNLLIYLEPEIQEMLVGRFYFALNPGGYLFLGTAEGVGALEDLFEPISKRRRIFRRLEGVRRPLIESPLRPAAPVAESVRARAAVGQTVAALAERALLEHFAPAAVVVRRTGEIVRVFGAMDRYIRLPTGEATLDIAALAREALQPTVRAALHDAVRRNHPLAHETIELKRDKRRATVRITVRPLHLPKASEGLWLMLFEDRQVSDGAAARPSSGKPSSLVRRLEAELRVAKKEQQQLVEQAESANEELKAANEEILSMNEELQSTNEELVTSKEELQSMNEELTTLNGQLQDKVQELTGLNDDLANLLVSTDIATVFVDTGFRIKRFTTAATQLLNLMPSDIGRPISHLATNLVDVDLSEDARAVLNTLTPIEKEAAGENGKKYLVRVRPYRSATHAVQGIVLTLVDITTLKETERELRTAKDELRLLNQTLELRIVERTKWLTLVHDITRDIGEAATWDEALHLVLRRICESEHWQIGHVYLPARDVPDAIAPAISVITDQRLLPFHAASERQRYAPGQSLPGRVYAKGTPLWLNDPDQLLEYLPIRHATAQQVGLQSAAALPVRFGRDVIAVLELFSDQPHAPSEVLENLMNDVSVQIGEVLERERATAHMADVVWREQQELLHTLHDSLGQTLTGLGMLSSGLHQQLTGSHADAAETARQVAQQAQVALEQVRQLSRGLFPVEVDPDGLLPALRELASTTSGIHKVDVRVEGELPKLAHDSRAATQLYRIAQEAVTNAVKHANAKAIIIELSARKGLTTLRVTDDGAGIQKDAARGDGLGLRIMRYRASSIGALLSIEERAGGGTIVMCTLRQTPLSREGAAR
jgi:two-component system CheB/CheR fusion protein